MIFSRALISWVPTTEHWTRDSICWIPKRQRERERETKNSFDLESKYLANVFNTKYLLQYRVLALHLLISEKYIYLVPNAPSNVKSVFVFYYYYYFFSCFTWFLFESILIRALPCRAIPSASNYVPRAHSIICCISNRCNTPIGFRKGQNAVLISNCLFIFILLIILILDKFDRVRQTALHTLDVDTSISVLENSELKRPRSETLSMELTENSCLSVRIKEKKKQTFISLSAPEPVSSFLTDISWDFENLFRIWLMH